MSLTASGIAAGIVLFNLTAGIGTVASAVLGLFVLVMLYFTLASAFSSDWSGREEAAATNATGAEPSDD